MSRLCPVLAVALMAATGLTATADENNYAKVLPSTVWIITSDADDKTSTGTGVFVDAERKLILTNAHVVGASRSAVVFFPEIKDGNATVKRSKYMANVLKLASQGNVLAVDRRRDLALIELETVPERAVAITLAEKHASPGQAVDLIGNPGGSDVLFVYTGGTVRSVYDKKFKSDHGEHEFRTVETQTPIRPGDSGGPVVNRRGELIALAQSFAPKLGLVSFCVDVSEIRKFLESDWKPAPRDTSTVLDAAELDYSVHSAGHYQIDQLVGDEKTQSVLVAKDTAYFQRADIRKIWTVVSTSKTAPDTNLMMRLLRQNSATKIGNWSVEKTADKKYVIAYVAKIDATAPDEAVGSTIEYVARIASAVKDDIAPQATEATASQTLTSWLAD